MAGGECSSDILFRCSTRTITLCPGISSKLSFRPGLIATDHFPRRRPVFLSESQEEVLRYLLQQTGPVPVDHLDGRVLRALASRGLVEESRGWVSPTRTAAPHLLNHTRAGRERSVRRAGRTPRGARSEAILRAVEALELALPRGAELMIGTLPAYADDVVAGLRRLAREME